MQSHALTFIQDLAIIMLIAGIAIIICQRFKQPIVLGYILAGMIVGPHTPPFSFISDETTIKMFAELGVIFLMFSLGLEFDLHRLSKVGKTAVIAAILEITLMAWLGYKLGLMFGWGSINALFLGAILSISSTTIIVKALGELGMKKEKFSQLIFGILIIEDIFAILILALLSTLAISGAIDFKALTLSAAKLSSFLVVSLIAGLLIVTRLLSYIDKFKNNETLLIAVLGLALGFCLLVVKFDYSVALGAFLIGAIIAESPQHTKIEKLIEPLRDMFSAVFFISVGLLFDPTVLLHYFFPILAITAAVIIGKVLTCSFGVLITGNNGKTSMRVGMGLAQIGEFSFIIASLGITLNVTGSFLYSIAVCVSIITTLTTPYLIKHSDAFSRFVSKWIPKKISSTFSEYVDWVQNIQPSANQLNLKTVVNKSILQIIVNLFIVVGIFLAGAYLHKTELATTLARLGSHYLQKSAIWAIALILSLPFLIAAFRKLKALSRILAELSIKKSADHRLTQNRRKLISEIVPIIAIFIIMLFICLLSTSILPPIEWLFLILVLVGVLVFFIFPWLIKIHSKLHISLLDSLKKNRDD